MWYFQNQPITEPPPTAFGFVYIIHDQSLNKSYIGQKRFWFSITKPPLKGSKSKRRSVKESDWRDYYGSNKTLCALVEACPEAERQHRFRREIISFHGSASELTYAESKLIFSTDALLSPRYFNEFVSCKINSKSVKNLYVNA